MEETNLMDGDNFAPTGTSEANFSTHCVSTLTISDEEADKASTEGDSDDPVAEKDILPGIAFFSPESIFEGMLHII